LYFTLHYPVTTLKHYHPVEFYDHLIDLYDTIASARMLARRIAARCHPYIKFLSAVRTLSSRADARALRAVRHRLRTDREMLSFHEGRSAVLPEFHHQRFEARMGAYAELIPRAERTPQLDPVVGQLVGRSSATLRRKGHALV
jgi:hypothetical protein